MNEAELEAALAEVWSGGGKPDWVAMDGVTYTAMTGAIAETKALERICTPAGLQSLFPALATSLR